MDITLTIDGELMVTQAEGQTEEGIEFVDAYMTPKMVVIDVGRILLPQAELPLFLEKVKLAGLDTIEVDVRRLSA